MGSLILIIVALIGRFTMAFLNSSSNHPDSFSLPAVAVAQLASLVLICLFGSPKRSSRKSWLTFGLWTFSTLFFSAAVLKFSERQLNLLSSLEITAVEMSLPLIVILLSSLVVAEKRPQR
jgi:hypothetical protein